MSNLPNPRGLRQVLPGTTSDSSGRDDRDRYGVLLPDGAELSVSLYRVDRDYVFGRQEAFGLFRIVEGPQVGATILRFWPLPEKGRPLGRGSNLVRDFIAVTLRRPPGKMLRPESFLLGCIVRVRTTVVTHDLRRREVPEAARYSRIDEILRLEAGTPPCLRQHAR